MNTEALKRRLGGKLSLPSLPEVVARLQDRLADVDVGMKELAEELHADPPLTARVLRIANSAYYSLSVPVLDVSHAVAILGLQTMKSLLLQVGVMDMVRVLRASEDFDPRELRTHSVFTAQVAGSFPRRLVRYATRDEYYVCGLLHDIGKFVLYESLRDDFLECVRQAEGGEALHRIERKHFDFTHADVGALVAERWGLPPKAVRAIGGHHDTRGAAATDPCVAVIALANVIAHDMVGKRSPKLTTRLPSKAVECIDLRNEELEEILAACVELQNSDRAA